MTSEKLIRRCAEMVSDGTLDELYQVVERNAFDRWKVGDVNGLSDRARYDGQVELMQIIRNLGTSGIHD